MKSIFFTCIFALTISVGQTKSFMFVFLNTNPNRPELPKETVDSLQKEHMANIDRLAKEGKLLAAGPFHGGGGIFVLNTGNVSEANEWLASDPAVRQPAMRSGGGKKMEA